MKSSFFLERMLTVLEHKDQEDSRRVIYEVDYWKLDLRSVAFSCPVLEDTDVTFDMTCHFEIMAYQSVYFTHKMDLTELQVTHGSFKGQ
jgi:hypothetical protein